MDDYTTLDTVARIANMEAPVLRNLRITQSYAELAAAMARLVAAGANWCTFATWASNQAGQTMRKEELAKAMEHWFGSEPAADQALAKIVATTSALSCFSRRSAPNKPNGSRWVMCSEGNLLEG